MRINEEYILRNGVITIAAKRIRASLRHNHTEFTGLSERSGDREKLGDEISAAMEKMVHNIMDRLYSWPHSDLYHSWTASEKTELMELLHLKDRTDEV